MRQLNQAAAEILYTQNNNDANVIDLHGLTLEESKNIVERYIQNWDGRNKQKVKIITGAGNHSRGNVGKLLHSMPRFVQNMGWSVENGGNGWFYIKPK